LLLLLFGTIANGQRGNPKTPGREEGQRKNNVDIAQKPGEQKQRGRRQQQPPVQGGGHQGVPPAKPTGPVGFGNHTLMEDGKVNLAPDWDGTTNTDCDVQLSDDKKQM
jgi:hypothetical protein